MYNTDSTNETVISLKKFLRRMKRITNIFHNVTRTTHTQLIRTFVCMHISLIIVYLIRKFLFLITNVYANVHIRMDNCQQFNEMFGFQSVYSIHITKTCSSNIQCQTINGQYWLIFQTILSPFYSYDLEKWVTALWIFHLQF